MEKFFGGIFWEKFFGRNFLGGFFGGDILGGVFGRNFLFKLLSCMNIWNMKGIDIFVKILKWGNARKEERTRI